MSRVEAIWRSCPLTEQVISASAGWNSVSIHGPSGQKVSKPLPRCPLSVAALQIAGGDVVGDGVTQDVSIGRLRRDPAAGLTDDHSQLGLVLDLLRLRRQADRLTVADDGAGRLKEEQRQLRDGRIVFGGMGGVVACHANDLPRIDRR